MRYKYITQPPYDENEDIYIEVVSEDEQHAYKLFVDHYKGLYGIVPIKWKVMNE